MERELSSEPGLIPAKLKRFPLSSRISGGRKRNIISHDTWHDLIVGTNYVIAGGRHSTEVAFALHTQPAQI